MRDRSVPVGGTAFASIARSIMSQRSQVLALSLSMLSLVAAPLAHAQWAGARGAQAALSLAPSYQDDYGYWRQQVRVASPQRRARWNAPPPGAVRVYQRRFDARWNWRSAPRHRVVYTYYRGDLWFLDPTTGWAWSIDRYGIVYTADPYRGWVYSLGPLTRWTADLLYFFDLYRFDRGYWYCRDYDYFVDLWEGYPRNGYYTYDTAYSTLWNWEPYWRSNTFISYSNRFSTVWVGQVRRHYDYIEHNPHYRRELIDSIGLPAVQAAPPRYISPRAVATTAYWEARDLAAAGMAPPPRGRDTGRGYGSVEAGTLVDAQQAPSRVVDPGSPAPGFNAPFPDGSYGFGVRPGNGEPAPGAGRGRDEGANAGLPVAPGGGRDLPGDEQKPSDAGRIEQPGGRERNPGLDAAREEARGRGYPLNQRERIEAMTPPQFEEPQQTPPSQELQRFEHPVGERGRDDGGSKPRDELRNEAPPEQPRFEPQREEQRFEVREEPQYQKPRDEPRFEVREEPRYEAPREEPRYEAPREEPRYEAPREEPRYEAPREEPRYEAPREEPRYEEQKEERQDEQSSSRAALSGLGVRED